MKYNPMSRKFQEDAKKLGLTGYQYYKKLVEEEKLPDPTNINRQNNERWAKNAGCENYNEYHRLTYNNNIEYIRKQNKERSWKKGIHEPMEAREDCSSHLGIHKGEIPFKEFLEKNIFEHVKGSGKGSHDKGIDFICKNIRQSFINKYPRFNLEKNKEYKIQLRLKCLDICGNWSGWLFPVKHNNADYFLLCALDNRHNLDILHIWMIHKDDIVRGDKFWRRVTFTITNTPTKLGWLEIYELTDELTILKELYRELKQI